MRPDFPAVVDSTMISAFRACPRKFEIEYLLHRRGSRNVHLIAGGAFAKGVEVARHSFFVEHCGEREAVLLGLSALMKEYGTFEAPLEGSGSAKTADRMAGALEFYFDKYPLSDRRFAPILIGDQQAIEFSFANPLPVRHPQTGDPILMCGRADMIATYAGAGNFLFDEKTTSSLGPSWTRQWDLRSQFTCYTWAAREWGLDVLGCIVRGISILKTKYETLECITYRPQWQIDRWLHQVVADLTRAIKMWEDGYFDFNLDHSCTEWGGCSYKTACLSPEPNRWLETQFEVNPWNPLRFTEQVSSG